MESVFSIPGDVTTMLLGQGRDDLSRNTSGQEEFPRKFLQIGDNGRRIAIGRKLTALMTELIEPGQWHCFSVRCMNQRSSW